MTSRLPAVFRLAGGGLSLPVQTPFDPELPSKHERRNLKPRLDWLFAQRLLPEGLQELSDCVREDGNDGAHAGNLTKDDVSNLLDFTVLLPERLHTEPERLRIAGTRRAERRDAGRV